MVGFLPLLGILAQGTSQTILVDPLLLVEANEVWSIIGQADNPVWPQWDARKTPILIYFPGKQDLLVNHPSPPAGFEKYLGGFRSPIGPIYLRNGKTNFDQDGQNTSTKIGGVGTLVVADTRSTLRQTIEGLAGDVVANPKDAKETIAGSLFPNPFDSMTMFAHEAFHVYQGKVAPKKNGNELSLTRYPSISMVNNVGFALEATYLEAAINAKSASELRQDALKWLASRQMRRASISKEDAAYEDGTEFSEGLAKYVEYRTLEMLQGRKPSQEMWMVQGFRGYGDLSAERSRLVRAMKGFMSGARTVNNDLYGASPVRFRLYYSGMAIGAMLDRLGAKWHDRMLKTDATLTSLATETLHPTDSELEQALREIKASEQYTSLVAAKTKLEEDGKVHIREELAKFDSAPGELVIDYSGLSEPKESFSFTPFGILRVDDERTIFRLVPISGQVGKCSFQEDWARPMLQDRKAKQIHLQLTGAFDAKSIGADGAIDAKELVIAGVTLKNVKGRVVVNGKVLTIILDN